MHRVIDLFIATFISLFVIVDPLGSASVFAAITKDISKQDARKIALKGVVIAISILMVFAFIGEALLHHMGISLHAFRVAGGTLLFVTAFQMIMGAKGADHFAEGMTSSPQGLQSLAVYPVAIPLLAGPGCMTAVVLHASEAASLTGVSIVALAVLIVQLISLMTMLMSVKIVRFMGHTGSSITARIVGVLLAALSVQFIADGIHGLMNTL
jgi:multiple antibiotic resistance protein